MQIVETTICYLCGKSLAPPTNVDHPVMQQIFAPEIRRKHNVSRLITLEVHQPCNTAYKDDEDYFVHTLMPFARGSEAGNAIYAKALNDFRAGKQVPLTKMVLSEFDQSPSGLVSWAAILTMGMSVYGPSRHFAGLQNLVAVGGIADIGTRWPEGSVACDPTATSSIARSARYLNRQHMIL
jgi:hypothetical protein